MARQLTDQDRTHIRSLSHLPLRDIARRVKRSTSTVAAVLGKPAAPAEPVPAPEPIPATVQASDAPADDAPLLDQLSRTIRSLEAAAAAARADGDVARLVSAERAATQAIGLLARLTPPPQSETGMMLVPAGDMTERARKGVDWLDKIADEIERWRATWPRCLHCGGPTKPANYEERLAQESEAFRVGVRLIEEQD